MALRRNSALATLVGRAHVAGRPVPAVRLFQRRYALPVLERCQAAHPCSAARRSASGTSTSASSSPVRVVVLRIVGRRPRCSGGSSVARLEPRATAAGARTVCSGRPAATVTAPERGPSRGSADPGWAASRVRASRRVTFGRTTFSRSTTAVVTARSRPAYPSAIARDAHPVVPALLHLGGRQRSCPESTAPPWGGKMSRGPLVVGRQN